VGWEVDVAVGIARVPLGVGVGLIAWDVPVKVGITLEGVGWSEPWVGFDVG
jgi:hypothetical protein